MGTIRHELSVAVGSVLVEVSGKCGKVCAEFGGLVSFRDYVEVLFTSGAPKGLLIGRMASKNPWGLLRTPLAFLESPLGRVLRRPKGF